MFIDSHAHLEMPQFDADRDAVLERARQAGVETVVAIGTGNGPGTLDCGIRLAERYPGLWATVGIHPHEAARAHEQDFEELESLAQHSKVVAWGEIGLDYFYDRSPREVQRDVFARQVKLAREAGLPIVIHCRPSQKSDDAWQDCFQIIEENGNTGIFHCFTGGPKEAQRALKLGFMISFSGIATFPRSQEIQEAARQVPLERMLIETDSPYLAPVPHRGKRNEPAFVAEVARHIAELRGITKEEVGRQTTGNFHRLLPATSNINPGA